MKPRRRRTTSDAPSTDVDGEARVRLGRMEAAVDVPRADDDVATSSTHCPPLERRNEEPSDGSAAAEVDGTS